MARAHDRPNNYGPVSRLRVGHWGTVRIIASFSSRKSRSSYLYKL